MLIEGKSNNMDMYNMDSYFVHLQPRILNFTKSFKTIFFANCQKKKSLTIMLLCNIFIQQLCPMWVCIHTCMHTVFTLLHYYFRINTKEVILLKGWKKTSAQFLQAWRNLDFEYFIVWNISLQGKKKQNNLHSPHSPLTELKTFTPCPELNYIYGD